MQIKIVPKFRTSDPVQEKDYFSSAGNDSISVKICNGTEAVTRKVTVKKISFKISTLTFAEKLKLAQ